jgi:pyruvate kinase
MTFRRAKIVCTLGPATDSPAAIDRLLRAGMDVARLNFSHGTHAEHARQIAAVRAASRRHEKPIAILADLQGPKIRTGALEGGLPVRLRAGHAFAITTAAVAGNAKRVSTTYQRLPKDTHRGDRILLDDGKI